jgi:hypothetical protein
MTTRKARNHQVRLSPLLYPHATIPYRHEQRIAVSADSALIVRWQTYFCSHGDFPSNLYVAAGELRIFSACLFSLLEQDLYAMFSYLLCGGIHV